MSIEYRDSPAKYSLLLTNINTAPIHESINYDATLRDPRFYMAKENGWQFRGSVDSSAVLDKHQSRIFIYQFLQTNRDLKLYLNVFVFENSPHWNLNLHQIVILCVTCLYLFRLTK